MEIRRRKYGLLKDTLRKDHKEICHSAFEWNPLDGKMRAGRLRSDSESGKSSFGETSALVKEKRKRKTFGLCSEHEYGVNVCKYSRMLKIAKNPFIQ